MINELGLTMIALNRALETIERRYRGSGNARPAREVAIAARSSSRTARKRA